MSDDQPSAANGEERKTDDDQGQHPVSGPLQLAEQAQTISNILYIILGLAALGASFFVFYFSNRVAKLKDIELQAYKKDADVRIAESNAKAETAHAKAVEAQVELERQRQVTTSLRQNLFKATGRIYSLEEAAIPRTITDEQVKKIVAALKGVKNAEPIDVRVVSMEAEANALGIRVYDALDAAGLRVRRIVEVGGLGTGFGIMVHSPD